MVDYLIRREKENRTPFLHSRRNLVQAAGQQIYSRWIRLRMKSGTFGPGIKKFCGGPLLSDFFFRNARVTLMMKRQILFSKIVMAVS
jgi:hypothetical protein